MVIQTLAFFSPSFQSIALVESGQLPGWHHAVCVGEKRSQISPQEASILYGVWLRRPTALWYCLEQGYQRHPALWARWGDTEPISRPDPAHVLDPAHKTGLLWVQHAACAPASAPHAALGAGPECVTCSAWGQSGVHAAYGTHTGLALGPASSAQG